MCDGVERITIPKLGHGGGPMNERIYLLQAQAADAVANAALSPDLKRYWEGSIEF